MLILTRQIDESIMIGDDIEITVLEFRGTGTGTNRVRIGITAPKEVPVHRKEIYEIIQKQKAEKENKE